jgi:uncharacterized protein (TIGR03435 family)
VHWKLIGVLLALNGLLAEAQRNPTARPEFDVASIKPSNAFGGATLGVGNGRASGHNVTLKRLIAFAYRLQDFQITGGPSWVSSDRFDVEAKAENPGADPDQLRLML